MFYSLTNTNHRRSVGPVTGSTSVCWCHYQEWKVIMIVTCY